MDLTSGDRLQEETHSIVFVGARHVAAAAAVVSLFTSVAQLLGCRRGDELVHGGHGDAVRDVRNHVLNDHQHPISDRKV